MKKISIIGIILIMVLCVTSCSKKDESKDTKTEIKMQQVSVGKLKLSIPSEWEQVEVGTNENPTKIAYYKSKDTILKIVSGDSPVSAYDKDTYSAYLLGVMTRFKNGEAKNISVGTMGGKDADIAEITFDYDNQLYTGKAVKIDNADFYFGQLQDSKADSSILEDIISSISYTENEDSQLNQDEKSLEYIFMNESMRWNMALEEVKDTEKREQDNLKSLEDKEPAYLAYKEDKTDKTDKYCEAAQSVYVFSENKLKAYWTEYDKESGLVSDYKTTYEDIKNAISTKYGECKKESVEWSDETYKDDESKWNEAFRYGYVTIKTTWETKESTIIIDWNYNKAMNVVICECGYESKL